MRTGWFVLLLAAGTGCGRYADFRLPAVAGSPLPDGRGSEIRLSARPAIERGSAGEWDSSDALNPSVVRRGSLYYNCYSGFDGKTWHTGLAVSPDGLKWEKRGKVLSPGPAAWEGDYIAANGSLFDSGRDFLYWYQTGPRESPRIGLARSADAAHWQKHPAPVVEPGPWGSWDERGAGDPYVIRREGMFYLFYLGQDRARRQRLGIARSADGVTWTKLRSSPVMELGPAGAFDEEGLGEPAVWASGGYYWMLYVGRDRKEDRRLGLARSRDGLEWRTVPLAASGGQEWNSRVMCDPEVEVRAGGVRVWFGGGDRASPDEFLNGRIGVAELDFGR